MLWMGNKVTSIKLFQLLIIPSLICMVVPTVLAGFLPAFRGKFEIDASDHKAEPKRPINALHWIGNDHICANI